MNTLTLWQPRLLGHDTLTNDKRFEAENLQGNYIYSLIMDSFRNSRASMIFVGTFNFFFKKIVNSNKLLLCS